MIRGTDNDGSPCSQDVAPGVPCVGIRWTAGDGQLGTLLSLTGIANSDV
jgi:hypothetical protein